MDKASKEKRAHLNTSYVKVQLIFRSQLGLDFPYLNTSYVKVQLLFSIMALVLSKFKYILC